MDNNEKKNPTILPITHSNTDSKLKLMKNLFLPKLMKSLSIDLRGANSSACFLNRWTHRHKNTHPHIVSYNCQQSVEGEKEEARDRSLPINEIKGFTFPERV